MSSAEARVRSDRLDVVCAGQTTWVVEGTAARHHAKGASAVAFALARAGLRVGVATVLPDDALGRDTRERLARAAIDVDGVSLAPARRRIVLAERTSFGDEARPVEVPEGWSARVLVVSGVPPVLERRELGERPTPSATSCRDHRRTSAAWPTRPRCVGPRARRAAPGRRSSSI